MAGAASAAGAARLWLGGGAIWPQMVGGAELGSFAHLGRVAAAYDPNQEEPLAHLG